MSFPFFSVSSSSSSSSFRLCWVLTGSSVAVWQSQPSSAGLWGWRHRVLTDDWGEEVALGKLRTPHVHTREQGRINKCGNKTLPSIFLFPPVTCMCGPFLSFPFLYVPFRSPPLLRLKNPNSTPSLCAFTSHECSRTRASLCTAFIKRSGDAECSAGLGHPWQQRTLWHVHTKNSKDPITRPSVQELKRRDCPQWSCDWLSPKSISYQSSRTAECHGNPLSNRSSSLVCCEFVSSEGTVLQAAQSHQTCLQRKIKQRRPQRRIQKKVT